MSRESKIWLTYFVWLQSTWLLQVLYASKYFYISFIPIIISALLIGFHYYLNHLKVSTSNKKINQYHCLDKYDLLNSLILIIFGGLLDSLWVKLDWIEFNGIVVYPFLAPFWIIVLWFHVGLLLRISFDWMLQRPVVGIALSFVSAFVCYKAADNLEALNWNISAVSVLTIGISWILALPGLLFLSEKLRTRPKKHFKNFAKT